MIHDLIHADPLGTLVLAFGFAPAVLAGTFWLGRKIYIYNTKRRS